MEILDVVIPKKQEDCSLSKCKLNSYYESHDDVRALSASIPPNKAVLKDTFLMPAGGTVVTRIHTEEPSLWYSHCHIEMHHFDGMAFILNVGNYSGSSSRRNLSTDMPSCDSHFVQTQMQYPSCDCYENPNAVLGNYLTSDYKCSRDYLCHHVHSRAANLERYKFAGGDEIHSDYSIAGWGISFIAVTVVCLMLALVRKIVIWMQTSKARKETWDAPAMIRVDLSVNPTHSEYSYRPQSRRLSTKMGSFSESMKLRETHIPEPKSEPTPKDKTDGSTNNETSLPKTESRREVMETYKTESYRSFRGSTRSFGSRGLSVVSGEHSCTSEDAITAEFISRPKGSMRKDFMLTYNNASGRSWAGSVLSDAPSIELDTMTRRGSRSLLDSSILKVVAPKALDKEDFSRRESSNSIISDVIYDPKRSVPRRESGDSIMSLLSSLGEIGDQEDITNAKRDRSSSNVSELSEALPTASAVVPSGTQPSRRVSFSLDTEHRLCNEEEKDDSGTVLGNALKEWETNGTELRKKNAFKVIKGTGDLAQAPNSEKRIDASAPFSEQLKHVVLTQYKIYRPLCEYRTFPFK